MEGERQILFMDKLVLFLASLVRFRLN